MSENGTGPRREARRGRHDEEDDEKMGNAFTRETPCPRDFDCRRCGRHVRVEDRGDRRTVFCCAYCEREYWRHRDRYERRKRISRGHVTDLRREHAENRREEGL